VNSNVEDKETLYGSPAISAGDYRRSYVHFRNLTEIVKRISELEKKSKESSND
jgi:UDP-3-O-[3-hydroxymyristoyl] glucosamine N-acyltransferase